MRRNTGDTLAGAATTTDLARPSGPSVSLMKACTSRPRSPTRPITTISALVKRVNIPSSTLLPTPEPAIRPTRWPRPSVSRPLMAFTPTSSTRSIGPRSIGFKGSPSRPSVLVQAGCGLPSSARPRASITRPSNSSPNSTWSVSLKTRTVSPGPMPTGSEKGIKKMVLSANPTTSASMRLPLWPRTSQQAPTGAMMPRASSRRPTRRTNVPLRTGRWLCNFSTARSTSASKSNIAAVT